MMNDPTHHSLQRAQGLPSARRCAPQAKEGAPIFFRACARRAASAGVCRGSALAAGRPPGVPPEAMVRRNDDGRYEKFIGFTNDLEGVGKAIDNAHKKYEAAENKLISGRGNLVNSVEKIKKLGAKTNKSISQDLIDKSDTEYLPESE